MKEIRAIYAGDLFCAEEEQAECLEQFGEENLKWACANCQKIQEVGEWTIHMLELRRLQKAGYPFKANDLTIEEWEDLGTINEQIEMIEKEQMLKMRLF